MSKIILYIATSLDGFIADVDGGVDWLPHPDDPEDICGYKALMKRIDTIVMGSCSYEQILTFGKWAWPDKQTYVFVADQSQSKQLCIELTTDEPLLWAERQKKKKSDKNRKEKFTKK